MNTFPAAATEMACQINSVTAADTMRSPQTLENEVGSSQVSSGASSSTIANQYHSNGSEANNSSNNIGSPSTTVTVSNSLVSDRKQQLEEKTITIGGGGKCAKNNRVLSSSLSSLSTSPSSNSQDTTVTINKPTSVVLQKYLQSQQKEENNKRTSLPNWFPSKRNSLILLADQNLDQLQKKEKNSSPKMVAPMQEQLQPQTANTTATFDVDSSEELQYGPGTHFFNFFPDFTL